MPLRIVRPKGRRSWYIAGAVAGVRIRESAKTTSRAVAESLRIRREAELEQRRLYGPRAVATFAEAVNRYLDSGGEARFLAPLVDRLGLRRLADLGQGDLDEAARALYPNGAAATLNRHVYTPFIAVMNEAAIDGLCLPRRWRRPRGHDAQTQLRWLSPAEFERIHDAASARLKPLLVFLAGAGVRIGEARALDWSAVDLPRAQAWIWETKSKTPRRVELPARTVAALANMPGEKTGPVFGAASIRTGLKAAMVRAGFGTRDYDAARRRTIYRARGGPHIFRHTFATWFYSATLDRARLKALGGWKSDQVDRYCHLAPRGLDAELRRFGWRFDGSAGAGNACGTDCASFEPPFGDVPQPFTTDSDITRQLSDRQKKARRQ